MENRQTLNSQDLGKAGAWKFIILVGVVSLFSDMTHEGARTITGPFLGILGAGAFVVSTVAGFGEFLGYAVRFVSGSLADRTKRYWPITYVGYGIQMFSVPALALAGGWEVAAMLILLERLGRAVRNPARDAMLSHATSQVGHGWGFGFHEAMDQTGAVIGPLVIAAVLYYKEGFRTGFAALLVPAILAVVVLVLASFLYPRPQHLEVSIPKFDTEGLPRRPFWLYTFAMALIGAGFADFPLIAYHFHQAHIFADDLIPISYAVAMGVDGAAALILGRLFDRLGMVVLIGAALLSAAFAPLVFLGGAPLVFLGMILWGVGMGTQESVIKAALAEIIPKDRRASAFGISQSIFGLFWFLGSVLMGVLYNVSLWSLIVFSVAVQLCSIPFFLRISREICFTSPRR
jgi:MFS family permease